MPPALTTKSALADTPTPTNVICTGICNCPDDFSAVCGKNGKTYRNECLLKCADVELAKKGPCPASSDAPDAADVRPPKGASECQLYVKQ